MAEAVPAPVTPDVQTSSSAETGGTSSAKPANSEQLGLAQAMHEAAQTPSPGPENALADLRDGAIPVGNEVSDPGVRPVDRHVTVSPDDISSINPSDASQEGPVERDDLTDMTIVAGTAAPIESGSGDAAIQTAAVAAGAPAGTEATQRQAGETNATVTAEEQRAQAYEAAYNNIVNETADGKPGVPITATSDVDTVLATLVTQRGGGWNADNINARYNIEAAIAHAKRLAGETEDGAGNPVAEAQNGETEGPANAEQQNDVTAEQQQVQELTQQLADLKGENASMKAELGGLKEQLEKTHEQMANLVRAMETKDEKEKITLLGMVKAFLKGVVIGAVVEIKDAAVEEATTAGKSQQGGH